MAGIGRLFVLWLLLGMADAFSPVAQPPNQRTSMALQMKRQEFLNALMATAVLINPLEPASAVDSSAFSTFQVSEAIKTMDMGLPSYNDISSTKASVGNVKSLTQELESGAPTSARKTKKAAPEQSAPLGSNLLPSLNKSNVKKADVRAEAKAKPEKVKKEPEGPKYEVVDMSLPSYSDNQASARGGMFSL